MIDHAGIVVGFKTFPHIDMYETGAHAARLLFAQLDDGMRRIGLGAAAAPSRTLRNATRRRDAARGRARAADGIGLARGHHVRRFRLADIRDAGMSVVVTVRTPDEAQNAADELGRKIWSDRAGFVYRSLPLADSVATARGLRSDAGPVLLLDHGDNVMSGGTCDTTTVLDECIRQGMRGIGVGPLCDPQTVAQAIAAGVGARIDIALGNKLPLLPGIEVRAPLAASARVRAITDGRFKISGPIYTGEVWAMGRTVVLETNRSLRW
jgi:microcystin degradation protein MlrC